MTEEWKKMKRKDKERSKNEKLHVVRQVPSPDCTALSHIKQIIDVKKILPHLGLASLRTAWLQSPERSTAHFRSQVGIHKQHDKKRRSKSERIRAVKQNPLPDVSIQIAEQDLGQSQLATFLDVIKRQISCEESSKKKERIDRKESIQNNHEWKILERVCKIQNVFCRMLDRWRVLWFTNGNLKHPYVCMTKNDPQEAENSNAVKERKRIVEIFRSNSKDTPEVFPSREWTEQWHSFRILDHINFWLLK